MPIASFEPNGIGYTFSLRFLIEDKSCNHVESEEAEIFISDAIHVLQQDGFRITSTRIQVIRALAETRSALSPNLIRERIADSGGRIDLVSVYRILQTLLDVGLVHHIGIVDGYYACRSDHEGGNYAEHLVCRVCGCVAEVGMPIEVSKEMSNRASTQGFETAELHVEILGVCRHCVGKQDGG